MPKFTLDKFCGCIELKTGCIIIGSLHLIESILYMIMTHPVLDFVINLIEYYRAESIYWNVLHIMRLLQLLLLVYSILALVFICLLFIGLYKNKQSFVKAYLINNVVFTVISVLYIILLIQNITGSANAAIGVGVLVSVMKFYFCTIIRNQYRTMEKPSNVTVIPENAINAELI